MEERLDDAINVLRTHAESPHPSFHGMTNVPPHLAVQQHSNGLLNYPPPLESHLVSQNCVIERKILWVLFPRQFFQLSHSAPYGIVN